MSRTSAKKTRPVGEAAPISRWPATKIEMWDVADLTPYVRNARTHPEAQVAQIAASMERFGFTIPMLVAEDGTIIAGHGRLMAAQRIGLEEVPVMVARGWSDEDRRLYTLADNRLAETSEWDVDMLRIELDELRAEVGQDALDAISFGDLDLASILPAALREAGATDPDKTPEPEAVAISRPGDVWVLGNHRIICGDSTDAATVAALLGEGKPHLMVTDPPYGVKYDPNWRNERSRNSEGMGNRALGAGAVGKVLNDDRADWREAWALFPGEVAYVWCASLFSPVVAESLEATEFGLRSLIIWDKTRLIIGRSDYHWQHEPCWYAVRKGATGHWNGDRKQTTVWAIPHQKSDTGHGTQKPVECMKRPIENNSKPGDLVYEPFSGSGTTIIAAEMSGRRCRAIELNPVYVDVAVRRWQEFTGEQAVLEGTGQTFAEIAAERAA